MSGILSAVSINHVLVEAVMKFEETKEMDDMLDDFVYGVVEFFKKLASSKKKMPNGAHIPYADLGISNKKLEKVFGKLTFILVTPDGIMWNGAPLAGSRTKDARMGGFYPEANAVELPYLEPKTGVIMDKRVNAFGFHRLLAHEIQHYLDHNGFNPEIDSNKINKERVDIQDWYSRSTEFNAFTREITHLVRRFLRMLETDQQSTKPKFRKDKIHELFGVKFAKRDTFVSSIFDSLENKRTPIAIFEFGIDSHGSQIMARYRGAMGGYKFHKDFDEHLTEVWRYVRDWYQRADRKYKFSKALAKS